MHEHACAHMCLCMFAHANLHVCMHIYVCVHMCAYVCLCVCVNLHVWRAEVNFGCSFSSDATHLCFETGSLI